MRHPNVIVFFTDQQRWDCSGLHGNPLNLTPNFDRMASHGTHVSNSFTCQPVCGPARACLQTGKYAGNAGVHRNWIPLGQNETTLANCFGSDGYQTGYIGKWHLGPSDVHGVVTEEYRGGYDYWLGGNCLELVSDVYDTVVFDNDNKPVKLPGYRTDALTDAGIRYVDAHKDKPFFLFLSLVEPHFQNHIDDYPPPDGYRERYTGKWTPPDLAELGGSANQHLGGYWGMVKRIDEALGRLLDALKSMNLLDNTIVLFTSDHGCHFKTRNNEYKRSCHESSIRVPTAICGPGFQGGGRIDQLVSIIDLPPSLLEAAGLPIPESMQGRSILPLTKGCTEDWSDDVYVQISESQLARAIRTKRWKYGVTAPDKDPFNDVCSDPYREEFLYDLACDPYELTNLIDASSHQCVTKVMRQRLQRRFKQTGEPDAKIDSLPLRQTPGRHVTDTEAQG